MDWLRIGAFALLILYHIGMVFVPWNFHVKTAQPIDWVAVPMQAVNAWRLPLLFVVSGYASRAILSKRPEPGVFAWERTKRLIIPLLVASILIVPPQPWVELTVKRGYHAPFWHFWWHDYFRFGSFGGLIVPTWQHLWFVAYLWVYSMIFAALAAILPGPIKQGAVSLADRLLAGPLVLVVPIALLLANMAWNFPGAAETHGFIDDWPIHRVYFLMFLFGVYLRSGTLAWAAIRRWWRAAAIFAVAGYAIVAAIETIYPDTTQPPVEIWWLFSGARVVQQWTAIIALIGIADRWWNHDHAWRATLNEAIFPFYIIHQTIIVLVAGGLLVLALHPAAEFAVILIATIAGCWAFYLIGRRYRWVRPLIGLRGLPSLQLAS
jgi:surface polysaccharide O-acyltransferase-like enzyme